jgi:hypothetical protein
MNSKDVLPKVKLGKLHCIALLWSWPSCMTIFDRELPYESMPLLPHHYLLPTLSVPDS